MRSFFLRIVFPCLIGAVIVNSLLFGQIAAGEKSSDSLTGEAAVTLALERSRELEALRTGVRIAGFRLESSGKIENPELRLRDLSTRYMTEEFDEIQVGLRWRPPELGESAVDRQEARVRLWRRKVEARQFRVELASDVRCAFARVVLCDSLVGLARRKKEVEAERTVFVEGMVNLGERSAIDLTRARLEYIESKSEYSRTVNRRGEARNAFSRLTGAPEAFIPDVEEPPDGRRDIDLLIEDVIDKRPEIELARQRSLLLEKEQQYASRRNIPWPTFIELSYHALRDREDWDEVRLGVILPLFNWNGGNRKAAGLAVRGGDMESVLLRKKIESDIRAAYANYVNRLQEWETYRRDIDPLITEAVSIVTEAKKHGTMPIDDILEMELTVIEAEEELNEKIYDLACALAEVYLALGIDGPGDIPSGGGK